jgi:penicillin-binding protein 1B
VFLTTVAAGILGYYWWVFSARVDKLLKGEIFTRSAGIYAAPRELHTGEELTTDDLVDYLKHAGYVLKGQQAEESRGRFSTLGTNVDIEPSGDATVDGANPFPRLRVQFGKGGKSIAAITDLQFGSKYDRAALEPELISAVTGKERAKRRVIGFNDIPKNLVNAITVTEDRDFFNHYGVNIRGIIRALIKRYDSDPNSPIARQGGSSITQQLVKNLLLSPERSIKRKLSEAYMSIIIETRLSKEQIFALYCNQVYLGQQSGFSINGFGEASESYFNKDVTNLTLPEAAFLAGIIRSPNRYNPNHDINVATDRRNQVLKSMAETGVVSEQQSTEAVATPLQISSGKGRIDTTDAPYFADYVQNQLGDLIADQGTAQHLRIYTSVDMQLQRAAYAAVTKQLAALDKIYAKRGVAPGTLQAALVALNPHTGEIVSMVGGRDYAKSQLNRAADAMRQPGSVFKPFVYATALNTAYDPIPRVITPATMYDDAPKTFTYDNKEYTPGNFGDTYSNAPVTLRDALVHSLNVVTVDVAMEVTIGRVMNLAAKAGLPKVQKAFPAMALGTSEATPLQIASAYTSFANLGSRVTPVAIDRVTTGAGVTMASPKTQKSQVLRPEVAYVMTSFMKDVVTRGTAAKLKARGFKWTVAGKTGTSRDGWFAGYTPNLVCAVWVGFDDNSQLGMTGADSALPIWADFMTAALTEHPEWGGDWQMPDGLQQAEIDPKTGGLARPDDLNKRVELFINNTAPTEEEETLPEEGTAPLEDVPPGSGENEDLPPGLEPVPSPRGKSPSKLEGHGVLQPDGSKRLEGTVTLDIDPTTGLIADPAVCPVIRSKTFVIGTEPHKYCGPEYHNGKTNQPSGIRPRLTSP